MSDDALDFVADLGLIPGRRVKFTVDGERVVEGPPLVAFRATPGERVRFDTSTGTAHSLYDARCSIDRPLAQLGVEGCRCGCMDGRRVR